MVFVVIIVKIEIVKKSYKNVTNMKVLIFDTETTGLPKGKATPKETEKWPHIIQLSYILFDVSTNKIIVNHDHVVKIDEDVELTQKSFEMHGISKEKSRTEGINIKLAIELFNICLKETNILIAHNIQFDKNMIMAECFRHNIQPQFSKYRYLEYCTMKRSDELCGIKTLHKPSGRTYIKFPTLTELHEKLFNVKPKGTHNSYIDILICLRCYYKLMFDKDVCFENKSIQKEFRKICNL